MSNPTTVLDLTRLMSDQDNRWRRLITRAISTHHPVAKQAKHFLETQWEDYFHKYLDVAFKMSPTAVAPDDLLNELYSYAHHTLYPAARAAGLPDSSFLLPDITLPSEDPIMTTNVSGPHGGGGARGGGARGGGAGFGGARFSRGGGGSFHGGGGHHRHGRGRRFFGGDGGYGYPYPVYDRLIVIDNDDDDEDDDFLIVGSNSVDPWRVMESSPPAPAPVLAGETPLPRDGLLADVAPVLAPASGGFTVSLNLDAQNRLHAAICVDGRCYRGSADLSELIAAVMERVVQAHRGLHASAPAGTLPDLDGVNVSGDPQADVLEAVDNEVQAAGEYLVGALLDRHVTVACAGWWNDLTKKAKSAVSKGASAIGRTLKKHSGSIAKLAAVGAGAAAVAIPGAGPFVAPMAAAAAKSLVEKATGTPAQQNAASVALATAQAAAKEDPRVATALAAAQKAVAQTTAAYHVAEAAKAAAKGDGDAAKQVIKLGEAAAKGDEAAKVAMDLAKSVTSDIRSEISSAVSGAPPWVLWSALAATTGLGGYAAGYDRGSRRAPVASGASPATGGRVTADMMKLAATIERDQKRAKEIAAQLRRRGQRLIGVEMTIRGEDRARFFENRAQSDSWLERRSDNPALRYVAVFDTTDERWPNPVDDTSPVASQTVGHWFVPMAFGAGMGALGFAGFQEWRSRHRAATPIENAVADVKQAAEDLGDAAVQTAEAVSGADVHVQNKIVRATGQANTVPELDDNGELTGRRVMWHPTREQIKAFGSRLPSFFVGDEGGMFLFKDPNGQPIQTGPYAGKKYLTFTPTWEVRYVDAQGQPTWQTAATESGPTSAPSPSSEFTYVRKHEPWSSGEFVGTGGPRVEIIGADRGLKAVRAMASAAAVQMPGDVLGILRRADGTWTIRQFKNADLADDWFGLAISNPRAFTYAAYYDRNDMTFPAPLNEEVGRGQPVAQGSQAIRRGIATTA